MPRNRVTTRQIKKVAYHYALKENGDLIHEEHDTPGMKVFHQYGIRGVRFVDGRGKSKRDHLARVQQSYRKSQEAMKLAQKKQKQVDDNEKCNKHCKFEITTDAVCYDLVAWGDGHEKGKCPGQQK